MKNLMKYVTLGILPVLFLMFVVNTESATFKRPLTLKTYGDMRYYEWSGSAITAAGDSVNFYADTANKYGVDPAGLLSLNRSATAGLNPWYVYPGVKVPEKLCGHVGQKISAGATITFRTMWRMTKSGTDNIDVSASSAIAGIVGGEVMGHPDLAPRIDPGKFFWIAATTATAVDTITRLTVYPCDD